LSLVRMAVLYGLCVYLVLRKEVEAPAV
jgi:hypothetical protein